MKRSHSLAELQQRMRSRAEPRPTRGRPALSIAAELVRKLASFGLENKEIAGASRGLAS